VREFVAIVGFVFLVWLGLGMIAREAEAPASDPNTITLTGPAAEAAERVERMIRADRRVRIANLDVEILGRLVMYRPDDLDLAQRWARAIEERERAIEERDEAYQTPR
jgi:hypothetical protein